MRTSFEGYMMTNEKRRKLRDLSATLTDVRKVKTLAQARVRALLQAREAGAEIPDATINKFRGQVREASSMLHAVATKWAELQLELAK